MKEQREKERGKDDSNGRELFFPKEKKKKKKKKYKWPIMTMIKLERERERERERGLRISSKQLFSQLISELSEEKVIMGL